MSSSHRKLTRKELRENSAVGSDDMSATDALARVRWDPSVHRKAVKLGIALHSDDGISTCRSMYRPSHVCKCGGSCRYEHVIRPYTDADLATELRSNGNIDAVVIVREIDYFAFDRLCAAGKLSPSMLLYIRNRDSIIWSAYAKDRELWHDPTTVVIGTGSATATATATTDLLEQEGGCINVDALPEAALMRIVDFGDDRAAAALASVSRSLVVNMDAPKIWALRLQRMHAFRAAELVGRVMFGDNWMTAAVPDSVEDAAVASGNARPKIRKVPRMSLASDLLLNILGKGKLSDEDARQLRTLYLSIARTTEWGLGLRSLAELHLLNALKVGEGVPASRYPSASLKRIKDKEVYLFKSSPRLDSEAGSNPIERLSPPAGLRKSPQSEDDSTELLSRLPHMMAAEISVAREIDNELRLKLDAEDAACKMGSKGKMKLLSSEVQTLRRLLSALMPSPAETNLLGDVSSEELANSKKLRTMKFLQRRRYISGTLDTIFKALCHPGMPSLDEQAAAEELGDLLEAESERNFADILEELPYDPSHGCVHDDGSPACALYLTRPSLRIKDCGSLQFQDENSTDNRPEKGAIPPVGVFCGLGAIRGGSVLGANCGGLTASIKAASIAEGKIVLVDKSGAIRVHGPDGTRLAAGRATGLSGGSSMSPATGGDVLEGRCCSSVCDVSHGDNIVVTGHPDGSVVISVMGAGQAMRAGAGLRFDDTLLGSQASVTGGRTRSGSAQVSAHTTVALMEHGSQLLVGRKVLRSSGALRSGGSLTLYSPETGDIIRNFACKGLDFSGSLAQLPTVIQAISPHSAVVGMTDGSFVVWDVRTNTAVIEARLMRDPARKATAEIYLPALASRHYEHAANSHADPADVVTPLDEIAAEELRDPMRVHVPGSSHPSWYDSPVDCTSAIKYLHANEHSVLESRVYPILPAIGDPEAVFTPMSSPFVRSWDLRGSLSSPFHVIDLGPKCCHNVAGVYFDDERVVIAHQHLATPLRETRAAAAARAGAAPMFHWNHRDRALPQAEPGMPRNSAHQKSRLWYQLLQSDLTLASIPNYAWPKAHMPSSTFSPSSIATALYDTVLTYAGEAPDMRTPVFDIYGNMVAVPPREASSEVAESVFVPAASSAAVQVDEEEPAAEPPLAFMSGISIWHPHTLSLCAYVPTPSVSCLNGTRSALVVGTDAGALYWHTASPTAVLERQRRNSAQEANKLTHSAAGLSIASSKKKQETHRKKRVAGRASLHSRRSATDSSSSSSGEEDDHSDIDY